MPEAMARRGYAFSGTWTVDAPRVRVHDVLVDLERYPEWWPQVRAVASLGADDALVVCRSTLPYTLDLHLHAVRREPERLEVAITGDLDGRAAWRLAEQGGSTRLEFEQEVTVGGWLALLSPVVRPVLRWNHARMMAGCVQGLRERVVGL
jgi:carbon monoxide dehydrogenase subunit G